MKKQPQRANGFALLGLSFGGLAAARKRKGRAFTLVELLAVILIIMLLVAVVIGISTQLIRQACKAQTKLCMTIIMNAVDVYYEEFDGYPAAGTGLYSRLFHSDWGDEETQKKARDKARKILASLPKDTVDRTSGNFLDGFGRVMTYHASGGVGGGAYLESPGADGDLTTKADNIRSDRL